MRRIALSVLVTLAMLSACDVNRSETASSPSRTVSASPGEMRVGPLLGMWQRVTSCRRFLRGLERAGLGEMSTELLVWSPSRWFPSEDRIPTGDRCRGATEAPYTYYFAEDGRFGLVDDDGVLVEDESYEPIDGDTITMHLVTADSVRGDVTVDYRIRGDVIRFDVVVPRPCKGTCREVTAWAIAALYPGPLERVD